MARKKTKLELTWIGKDNRPRLEPRILLEDPDLSYAADRRVSEGDIFDNMLIQGDNLLALKALEQEFTGKVKCVYIERDFPSLCFALATGVGKTRLMGAFISYLYIYFCLVF